MDIIKSITLMRKYNSCESCGSEVVGNGEGSVSIESEVFHRSCKCGWSIKTDEDGNVIKD